MPASRSVVRSSHRSVRTPVFRCSDRLPLLQQARTAAQGHGNYGEGHRPSTNTRRRAVTRPRCGRGCSVIGGRNIDFAVDQSHQQASRLPRASRGLAHQADHRLEPCRQAPS